MNHIKNSTNGQSTVSASDEDLRVLEVKRERTYVTPAILSHSGEDVLEDLGPAQACYPFSSCGVTP